MNIRKFYLKHMDILELTRAYFGVFLFVFLAGKYNLIPHNLEGLFNSQIEIILDRGGIN